ncbi:peptidylprolyl isomerase [Pseudorhodoferax soli]|uniref:peptidylprolyl isomerase n=1 Tax=Pseudorhodoferax soli TaxID=545864 RepID=A0A368XXX4_9BURK|nr:peptidylprolyl isomerase [Pseudorhodoferax soli]RCW72715.1 peptidyl-prolyl cis-trans isomerase C [Pseudorhodoferax soli]
MKKSLYSAVAAALVLGAASMPAFAQNVAVVNGKAVPKARVDALAEQMARAGRPVTPDQEGQLREEVIMREVFMQEAQKRGLDASPDFQAQMEFARQSLLVRELLVDYQKAHPVTDAEVQAEYDKVKAANSSEGKEYKAQHILVEKEADAKAIIASLKKGGKFEDIAKKQSKDPGSGANGGDLGWANPAGYVKEFGDALTKLKKGQTTDVPVKTQFGYHIIRLNDERQQEFPPLEQVKPQIAQQLQQQKMQQYQQELRAKAKVE